MDFEAVKSVKDLSIEELNSELEQIGRYDYLTLMQEVFERIGFLEEHAKTLLSNPEIRSLLRKGKLEKKDDKLVYSIETGETDSDKPTSRVFSLGNSLTLMVEDEFSAEQHFYGSKEVADRTSTHTYEIKPNNHIVGRDYNKLSNASRSEETIVTTEYDKEGIEVQKEHKTIYEDNGKTNGKYIFAERRLDDSRILQIRESFLGDWKEEYADKDLVIENIPWRNDKDARFSEFTHLKYRVVDNRYPKRIPINSIEYKKDIPTPHDLSGIPYPEAKEKENDAERYR